MSGVKNLRAMFEQRGENNPPDRGRSPGPGIPPIASPTTESPRPLSKVRTSFVAVEKDGRIGLRREPSGESTSTSSQKLGNDNEAVTPPSVFDRSDASSDNMAQTSPFKKNLTYEPIPESPRQEAPSKTSPKKSPGTPDIAPNANPDKITDEEEPKAKMLPGNPTESSAVRMSGVTTNGSIGDVLNGTSATNAKPKTSKAPPKAVAPISTQAKTTVKALKSPMLPKAPLKVSSSTPEKKAAAASTVPAKDAPKKKIATKQPSATTKPASIDSSASAGASKPKPRSPTRPVKLPSSLTTHTASSASKFGTGHTSPPTRQTLSRSSGNSQHLNAVPPTSHRSPSRTSLGTAGTGTGARTQKRQSSSVPRQRPSVGPPPKQTARDHPIVKKEAQVDESFLARMMRPTQASSSKTSEKAPITPPRRAAPVKKTVPKEVETNAKKAAARVHAATSKPKEAKEAVKTVAKGAPTAKEVAPTVAQAETAEAATETAKSSTNTVTMPVAEKKEVDAAPTAAEVAPVVAQTATAEDAIETAKASQDTVVTPIVEKQPEAVVEPMAAEEVNDTTEKVEKTLAPAAVITPAPEKVEDIEELVQEAVEKPVEPQVEEEVVEAESSEPAPVEDESAPIIEDAKVEEPNVEDPKTEMGTGMGTEEVVGEGEQTHTSLDTASEIA
ncbi:hypothetical protein F5X99DRAFT_378880 [Biscogniauxia marginata]|nr:hypothetical protein F5X99DRAFT_378880 [Biscogniauxia marginata]